MRALSSIVDLTEKVLKTLLIVLMGLLVVNVSWQVITRFLMTNPSSFTEELSRFMLIWIGLLGSALAYKDRMHLGIDILTNKLTGKKKLYADIAVHMVAIFFAVAVMVVGGYKLVALTLELNQLSASLGILVGYVYLALPISGALILLYSLYFIAVDIETFKSSGST
ncbi:MAG: TRAP transporter small permease [Gammaproteobacteria bacterium]|nr:TRAP transporter small permease [Gammaproteobacteria bacterium]